MKEKITPINIMDVIAERKRTAFMAGKEKQRLFFDTEGWKAIDAVCQSLSGPDMFVEAKIGMTFMGVKLFYRRPKSTPLV